MVPNSETTIRSAWVFLLYVSLFRNLLLYVTSPDHDTREQMLGFQLWHQWVWLFYQEIFDATWASVSWDNISEHWSCLTVSEGEAVDQRHAIKPVVVLAAAHREEARPVPEQSALQPGRDGTWGSKVTQVFTFLYIFMFYLFIIFPINRSRRVTVTSDQVQQEVSPESL